MTQAEASHRFTLPHILPVWLMVSTWMFAGDRPQVASVAVPCVDVTVLDGDSVRASLALPFGVTLPQRTIRAAGYDAWESSRHRRTVRVTDEEIARGRAATAALVGLVASGGLYAVDSGQRDTYGRVNAFLWVRRAGGEWVEVKAFMEQGGHVRILP